MRSQCLKLTSVTLALLKVLLYFKQHRSFITCPENNLHIAKYFNFETK